MNRRVFFSCFGLSPSTVVAPVLADGPTAKLGEIKISINGAPFAEAIKQAQREGIAEYDRMLPQRIRLYQERGV